MNQMSFVRRILRMKERRPFWSVPDLPGPDLVPPTTDHRTIGMVKVWLGHKMEFDIGFSGDGRTCLWWAPEEVSQNAGEAICHLIVQAGILEGAP